MCDLKAAQMNGNLSYLSNPSTRAGYDTRSIFKQSLTGLNSEFSFSKISCLTKAEELSLPYYLPIAGGRIIGFIPFARVLVLCEMQSVSSRNWSCVAVFISYDDNHYTMGTYNFTKLDHIAAEAAKNIWCAKSEDPIDHSPVIRWFKKFCSGCKNLHNQASSGRIKTVDSVVIIQTINTNLMMSTEAWHLTVQCGLSPLQLCKNLQNSQIVSHVTKILQNFQFTLAKMCDCCFYQGQWPPISLNILNYKFSKSKTRMNIFVIVDQVFLIFIPDKIIYNSV